MLFITEYKASHPQIETKEVIINRKLQNWYCKLSLLIVFCSLTVIQPLPAWTVHPSLAPANLLRHMTLLRDQKESEGVVPSYADVKTV
jgi:hypothetical protein